MGVKMLFYPIEYTGTEWYRESPNVPYGVFGWQGVVPCKTEKMASRLTDIVTDRLLTVEEAFGRLDPNVLAELLLPIIEEELLKELPQAYGGWMISLVRPVLPYVLGRVLAQLQKEIDGILDLRSVVLEAFVRDKQVLVELFQKVRTLQTSSTRITLHCTSLCKHVGVVQPLHLLTNSHLSTGWKGGIRFSSRVGPWIWIHPRTLPNDGMGSKAKALDTSRGWCCGGICDKLDSY